MSDDRPLDPRVSFTGQLPVPVKLPEAQFPMLEKPRYRWVAETFSAIEPEVNCWDAGVVKRLRELEPDFLPLVVRSVYRNGYEDLIFERHILAYQTHTPHSNPKMQRVAWPTSPGAVNYGRHNRGAVVVENIWEAPKRCKCGNCAPEVVRRVGPLCDDGLPGAYRPFDWRVYRRFVEAASDQRTANEQAADYIARQAQQMAKGKQEVFDRIDYESEADRRYDRDLARSVSGPEIDAIGAPREQPKKGFVHLKGVA